jgi:type I restriction enzyme S subunit
MAGEWREVALGDIADLVRGVSYRPADLLTDEATGVPLLRATNIRNRALELTDVLFVSPALVRDQQLLRRFDVVIAMSSGSRDAVGRLAQLRRDWTGCIGAFCGVIRADPSRVDPEYVGYVLQSPEFRTRIETYAVGTAIMNLSRERILGFSFQLPNPPEQRAIAHILGTLDDKIELNRKQNETLEAMARALFKAWFVDFEPVRAKMEGRWQRGRANHDSHLPGLPAHLYDLFPDRLVESELGEIPEGWEVQPLSELLTIIGGGTPKTSVKEYWDGDIPWFSVVDTPPASDVFVVSTEKTITSQGLAGSSARLIPKGTTIISARGTVGNLAIAGREMTFNQSCYGLRGNGYAGDYRVPDREKNG